MKRSFWLPVLLLALVGAALLTRWERDDPGREWSDEGPPRAPRTFRGTVLHDGRPVQEVRVRLLEDVEGGAGSEVVTDVAGRFEIDWIPHGTTRRDRLFLSVEPDAGDLGLGIVPARPEGNEIHLTARARLEGRVVDLTGDPLPGAQVVVAAQHGERWVRFEADEEGRFAGEVPWSLGTPLDVLARADGGHTRATRAAGLAARWEGRFRAGEPVTIHLQPGRELAVRVRDPRGDPVAGAQVRLALPRALRAIAPSGVADAEGFVRIGGLPAGMNHVEAEAPGHVAMRLLAAPGPVTEVVLWPAHEVEISAWDAWNSRGVEQVAFEVDLHPAKESGDWWGSGLGSVEPQFAVRPGRAAGSYRLRLPACAAKLRLTAPAYGDAEVEVPARADRATVRMQPPLSRDKPARVRLTATGTTARLPVVVRASGTDWHTLVVLDEGAAWVTVPPDARLRIASACAMDGVWIPRQEIQEVRRGEVRTVRLALRPAVRLTVVTEPSVEGEALLTDLAYERLLGEPRRAVLEDGVASFWARPQRKVRVRVEPLSDRFPHEGEFETGREDREWVAQLRPAAAVRFRLRDEGDNPVPFVATRLWAPGANGRPVLYAAPRAAASDPAGEVRFGGLHTGEGAAEFAAPGFRTVRTADLRLLRTGLFEGGEIVLHPAPVVRGRILDVEGAGRAGMGVRIVAPALQRLPLPGGGERLLFDLAGAPPPEALTDAEGRFALCNAAPREGLLLVEPGGRPRLAPAAFALSEKGEYTLAEAAYVELEIQGPLEGVYLMLPDGRSAVLVRTDPPMGLRPLPVLLPAGRCSLYIRMRDRRWAAPELLLEPGRKVRLAPEFRRWPG